MNIYKLISPVNKYNYVNIPIIKNNQDYNYQHSDNAVNYQHSDNAVNYQHSDNAVNYQHESTETTNTRKLSVLTKGKKYSDKYLRPKINVIANFMQLEQKTIPAINKRAPEIVQGNSMYFSDPNTKYDELLTATPTMLNSVEPINYFGCRVVGDYLYNFDIGMVFKIIPKDFLARYIDPTMIKESTIYVDSRSAMIMPQKSAFKNIWMDTKRYIPIHPKYVESIDVNSLIQQSEQPFGVNLNQQPPDTYYTTPLPVGSDSLNHAVLEQQQPVRSEEQLTEQPVESPVKDSVTEEKYKGPFIDVSDEPVILEPDEPVNTVLPQIEIPPFEQPVIESYQQRQQDERKKRILEESLNEQQQQKQPIRRRRKPKNDKI